MKSAFIGRVLDNYRILDRLGIGGMGMVFKALNIKLDKLVAIKMIAPGLAMNESFIKRFETEAKALARLEDPNIVGIHDLRTDTDQWFIVMEYVEGITLADKIKEQGAMPWQDAFIIFKQMLSALNSAHRAGIIHRDIKPNNVMINSEGVVKVTDFGLAKDKQYLGNTITLSTGGTLFYMSPEQVKDLSFTDYRSDIYSLGITLYEMLAGEVPFEKSFTDFDIRETIVRKQFPPLIEVNSDVPEALNEIVTKAIEKDPEKRYQNIDDMQKAIDQFEQEQSSESTNIQEDTPGSVEVSGDPIINEKAAVVSLKDDRVDNSNKSNKTRILSNKSFQWKIAVSFLSLLIISLIIFTALKFNFHQKIMKKPGVDADAMLIVSSNPQEAAVFLNGDSIGVTPINNMPVKAGSVSLFIKRRNFFDIDTLVSIEKGQPVSFSFQLAPAAVISLNVTPLDAQVQLDGKKVEPSQYSNLKIPVGEHIVEIAHNEFKTKEYIFYAKQGLNPPLEYRLIKEEKAAAEDKHKVVIRREGYEEFSKPVNVNKGQTTEIKAALVKLSGSISIESDPAGASIWLDEIEIKERYTPFTLEKALVGSHTILLKKKGYSDFSTNIEVKENKAEKINAELTAMIGKLQIHVKPWGSIYIDGELNKKDTDIKYTTELPACEHIIRVVHPTFGVCEKTIEIEDKKSVEMTVDFTKFVTVSVTAFDSEGNPVWGDIIVDDEETGEVTPKEIKLRTGLRKIAVKKEGYDLVGGEKQIMVDEDFEITQKFILRRKM